MIAHLRGPLIEKGVDSVVVEAAGVGYLVAVTTSTMRVLGELGSEARLHIHSHATQDSPVQLFGFVDPDERRLFETLLAVQGVGPKVALAILSGLATAELIRAITSGDIARLTKIRGVGRKTAERLTVELRDKLGAVRLGGAPGTMLPGVAPQGKLGEVHGALVSLGYRPGEFEAVLGSLDPELSTTELIKRALAALRRR